MGEDVDAAAEGDDEQERRQQRPAQRPVLHRVEDGEGGGAREDGDDGRRARELAPLAREGDALLVPGHPAQDHALLGRHSRRVLRRSRLSRSARFERGAARCARRSVYSRRLDGPAPPPPHRAARLRRRAAPGRAAGRARRLGRAAADRLPRRRPGLPLRHAQRAARPRGGAGRLAAPAAALCGPAPPPAGRAAADRALGRPWTGVGGRRLVLRGEPRARAAALPPRRARPARDRAVGCAELPEHAGPALARPVPAGGARGVRAAHRAPARVLLHGGHRARPRAPARHLRRERGRADGHLLRHARRAAVRAGLPAARGPAHPRLDRRARRPAGVPARHVQGAAARAARAVRRRPLPRRDGRTRWPTSARSPRDWRAPRCAAAPSTGADAGAPSATPTPTRCSSCSSRATSTPTSRRRCPRRCRPRGAGTPRSCCACGRSARARARSSRS